MQSINGTWSVVRDGNSDYLTYSPTSFQPVPAPPAAVSLLIGGVIGLAGTRLRRLRMGRRAKAKAAG